MNLSLQDLQAEAAIGFLPETLYKVSRLIGLLYAFRSHRRLNRSQMERLMADG